VYRHGGQSRPETAIRQAAIETRDHPDARLRQRGRQRAQIVWTDRNVAVRQDNERVASDLSHVDEVGDFAVGAMRGAVDDQLKIKLRISPHQRFDTAEDLKDIGVAIVGDRRKMLTAIAELSASSAAPAPFAQPATPAPAPLATDAAERRQLTAMFRDLVGSTALSARLDPEDMRDVIGAYHRCCANTVERNGGFVAKYMGDGATLSLTILRRTGICPRNRLDRIRNILGTIFG
jgi:hypothetical protein